MKSIEKYLKQIESTRVLTEDSTSISPRIQNFLDECDRLNTILKDDELFQKEKQKHLK